MDKKKHKKKNTSRQMRSSVGGNKICVNANKNMQLNFL